MSTYDLTILSHHKCATNWLRAICGQLVARDLIVLEIEGGKKPDGDVAVPAGAKQVLMHVNASKGMARRMVPNASKNIHFVRDPRDALVSNYFSWAFSHQLTNEKIIEFREAAPNMSTEDGMLKLLDLFAMGNQLTTWTDEMWGNTTTVRYEYMLADFDGAFHKIFDAAGFEIDAALIADVKKATTFQKMAGRAVGEEDKTKHFRKGTPGDWNEYFTDRLNDAFMEKYGWIGVKLGYW